MLKSLKIGNGYVIISHTLLGMRLYIHTGIKVKPCYRKEIPDTFINGHQAEFVAGYPRALNIHHIMTDKTFLSGIMQYIPHSNHANQRSVAHESTEKMHVFVYEQEES